MVAFGGIAARNSQVNAGGVGDHRAVPEQRLARQAGAEFVSLSPMRTDADAELDAEWLPIVPGTDVAVMLGLAHEIVSAGAHDREFLTRSTVGWEEFEHYLRGATDGVPKTAAWAAELSGIAEARIVELAAEIVRRRTVIAVAYSLQRADHGEQPVWMGLVLAAISGWFGRPGGGFAPAMGALHRLGLPINGFRAAPLSQGVRPIDRFIPVARIADALLAPGDPFDYDGTRYTYPDLRLVYWAGGNPFHHHQDLNRLVEAWQRPDTIIVHEHFANSLARHADIVFPAATFAERDDVAAGDADPYISAMVRTADPPPGVRTDFDILTAAGRAPRVRRPLHGGPRRPGLGVRALRAHPPAGPRPGRRAAPGSTSSGASGRCGCRNPRYGSGPSPGCASIRRRIPSTPRRGSWRSPHRWSHRSATPTARATRCGCRRRSGSVRRWPSGSRSTSCRASPSAACTRSSTTGRTRGPARSPVGNRC